MKIPNETVKHLFYDYISEGWRETDIFSLDLYRYGQLLTNMAYDGKWQPLFEYLCSKMRESMSLRDLITGEKFVQTFLTIYLSLNQLYFVYTEPELNKGFADILLEPFLAKNEEIKYSYLIEVKYLKAGIKPGDKTVDLVKKEAQQQLRRYSSDEKLKRKLAKTTLIKLIVIFSGHELIDLSEAK